MSASEIVVGIDFGTTYSGVSWAVNAGNKTVNLITNWPDPYARNSNNEKVPSKLSYDKNGKSKWGYTAGTVDVIKWMKILLEPTHDYAKDAAVVNAKKLLAKLNKTAEEVVADYLKELWNYAVKEIARKKGDEWRSIYKLRVVLTVPAVWTAGAKARTLQAAKKAGMPNEIQLVAEPEAAALAVLRDKSEMKDLEVGDTFVVCDAGGGTVDLISYEVLSLEPLQVKETAVGGGDLCGSVYLDAAFERHIAFLVGNAQYEKIEARRKNQMLDAFELGVKRCFDDQDGDDDFTVDLIGVEDDEENGIFGDTITVKRNALRTIFDTVFLQIEKLVSEQLSQIKAKGLSAKAIFLVGGFGESRYLYNRLKACHRGDGLSVLGVTSAWSAICRGATLWGLEHSDLLKPEGNLPTVSSRLSRHSYGVSLSPIFDPKKHLLIDKYTDGLGIDRANRQMTWYLRRGEEIIEGQKLDKPFSCLVQEMAPDDSDEIEFTHDLLYCPENEAPTREIATVGTYVTVSWKMACSIIRAQPEKDNPETGEKFYILSFVSNIRLDSTTMDFSVTFKSKTVGAVTTNYKDKFD